MHKRFPQNNDKKIQFSLQSSVRMIKFLNYFINYQLSIIDYVMIVFCC